MRDESLFPGLCEYCLARAVISEFEAASFLLHCVCQKARHRHTTSPRRQAILLKLGDSVAVPIEVLEMAYKSLGADYMDLKLYSLYCMMSSLICLMASGPFLSRLQSL
jgi:hypothetical protein